MTYACMECGEGLPQYKAGYCARCIADEEAHEYEAEDADEGREECEREPDRITHEGRDLPAFTSDRPKTVRALAKAHGHNLSRVRSQTNVVDSLTGKRLDTEQARDSSVSIPKDLAKLVLAELSPQWHTKAVRELLRTIEDQL